MNTLRVNGERLWATLMQMAEIGPGIEGGCNRQALTDDDKRGRDQFVAWTKELGCSISIDEVGNIFARRAGRDANTAPVLVGSHLDTQRTGGKFDGVYGVLAGIELLRTLNEQGIATHRPIDLAVWTNEEGCRFAPAMLGSGVVSGVYSKTDAYSQTDKSGLTFEAELKRIGYCGDRPAAPTELSAAFELHIEQGPVLERNGKTIGVVTGIQGAVWLDVTVKGASAHAGTTPMPMRRDPWPAATNIIQQSLKLTQDYAPNGLCTIGTIQASPGARNTVPTTLRFSIDLRNPDAATLEEMTAKVKALAEKACADHGLELTFEQIWKMEPTPFASELIDIVDRAAETLGLSRQKIFSGAGHDALHVAQFAPTTMIFIPSINGLSHNEAEHSTPEDITAGANVLLHAVLEVANR
jgi:N-carbamoyl-L-amino-acid hydrolase